jgi:hypothetical protein
MACAQAPCGASSEQHSATEAILSLESMGNS